MEKVLLLRGLGTGGRQNELIELAMTHLFDSMEIDMADLLGRLEAMGKPFALQFLSSARTGVGTFRLPVDFGQTDEIYARQIAKLGSVIELASALSCKRCSVELEAGNDLRTFQENFELQTKRIGEVSKKLETAGIRIGLKMEPLGNRKPRSFKFIENTEQLLTLIRFCGDKNVGLCLDTGEWMVTGGTPAQIASLTAERLVEVRFSDAGLPDGTTVIHLLPGQASNSTAVDVAKHLRSTGYDGAVAITGHSSLFASSDRHAVVRNMQITLDLLVGILNGTRDDLPAVEVPGQENAENEAVAEEAAVAV